MKTRFSTALALLLTAVLPAAVSAGNAPEPPTISTSGSAEMHVAADVADLNFQVEVRHADLDTARKKQADRAAKVLAALRAAGVEDKDLQTSQASIAATYAENRHGETTTVNYYDVTQSIVCTLHDVKKVAEVTTQIVAAGATEVGAVNLRLSDPRKTRDEARVQAAREAREKAVALATELGVKVGKPYKIAEGSSGVIAPVATMDQAAVDRSPSGGSRAEPPSVFAAGLLTISASVDVTFYLE